MSEMSGAFSFSRISLDLLSLGCSPVPVRVKQSVGSSFLAQKWFVYAFAKNPFDVNLKRRSAFIIAQDVSHQLYGDHGLCNASL